MNTTSHILIVGAGGMARAIAYDLCHVEPEFSVTAIDRSQEALDKLAGFIKSDRLKTVCAEASDTKALRQHFQEADLAIGAASYHLNLDLTKLAVETGTHWVDLGGNNDIVNEQFALSDEAKAAGVTIIPDCGLAPGMVSIIAGDAFSKLDTISELHFRVGGLPLKNVPPLGYQLCFSPQGLINEYVEPTVFIADGKTQTRPSLTDVEDIDFGAPLGKLEAFHTSGGASTMVETYLGKVEALDYKTLRYPGHCAQVKLLSDLGFFDSAPVETQDGVVVKPRNLTAALFERLGWMEDDLVALLSWAVGVKDGKKQRLTYRLYDQADKKSGLTAMARTTGFSAVVIARMILSGSIAGRGVLRQELNVPPAEYFAELRRRGIDVEVGEG